MKKQLLTAMGILAVAGGIETASASSSAQATIDWDNLSFQLIDFSNGLNAPTLSWTTKNGTVMSSATTVDPDDSGSGVQSRNNFTTAISSEIETLYAQSSATRNSNTGLTASATTQQGASIYDVNLGVNAASASATNSGAFQLSGNGLLLISLDWSVASSGSSGDIFWGGIGEWASASISISGSYNGQFTSGNASASFTTNPYWWSFGGPESQGSTFVMAVFNSGFEVISGNISATASATSNSSAYLSGAGNPAAVPLPASAWLFGSAMFGFLVQRRRKQA
ncbi:VPLPA-CTERM sorting domain-containing protein [Methylomonas sp. SURF-2]|uniref:VPLPA-CTERM sorting domain-containing protein n=1 Tax=Methylomonas subterranea TaxID=2952225 RepID=A0ABT1TE96_9GAMM|nr:VPLPA-CTERM sorting domain-containing protein [Methylomonas sp. SURF-2]MCQ8103740.1 VPLPA-CTERM sorting domain-containing protein [Methylomonas sp. SURF-2]